MKRFVEEKIRSVIGGSEILLIIPPFVTSGTPILGPHILQSVALRLGYKTDILHLNLLMTSIIGFEKYESVSYAQPYRLLGERFFARSAHGLPPLGKSPELCFTPAASVYGNDRPASLPEFEYKYAHPPEFNRDAYLEVENTCSEFIGEVIPVIASLDYKIIGCSTNWEQNNCSIALLKGIKHIRPDIITLIGGSNCEGEMARGIESLTDQVDYIFSGESEESFACFLENYAAGNLPSQRIIQGKPVQDMDSIPLPDYKSYINQRNSFFGENCTEEWDIGYETSRGCWWGKCYFCGLNGSGREIFRHKTARKSLDHLQRINRDYPTKGIAMVDKVMPLSYQNELLPMLSQNKEVFPIYYEQRAGISLKHMMEMKNAGISTIKPGIEALSTDLLELMNKGVTARQNILLLRNAAALGIYVDWNLLWGFPGDKADQYKETLEILPLLRHLCPPAVFRHICINRFSPYFDNPREFQIKNLRPWNVYHMVYPDWADVDKLAYRFIGDYPCDSDRNPHLIQAIHQEINHWKQALKTSRLTMVPVDQCYIIHDCRNIAGKNKNYILEDSRAGEIMTYCKYDNSQNRQWAVEQKLAVVVDGWYVPLVIAPPELLSKFDQINDQ